MSLTEKAALQAFARMINTGDIQALSPLLADGFRYVSQTVLNSIENKKEFVPYMSSKLSAARGRTDRPLAEVAFLPAMRNRPCLVLSRQDTGDLICTVLAETKDGMLSQVDLCLVPSPKTAARTGEFPA